MILLKVHLDIKPGHFVQRISEHHVAERATRGRPSDTLQLLVMPVLVGVVFVGFLTYGVRHG